MTNNLKKITLLHSNDIHGQFEGKVDENDNLRGSIFQLAGYVSKVKEEEGNAIFAIAGDAFQGSLIDSEFQGLSTIDILNMVPIDVMCIGNHEIDYGISHMLFVEKFADFDIINCNFKIKKLNNMGRYLYKPYKIMEVNGVNILFVGILTKDIVGQTKTEALLGKVVTLENNFKELRRTIESAKRNSREPIDLVVLLTHVGFDKDKEIAATLPDDIKVDLIIGGHSHTYLDEPVVVNNVVIAQAGMENTHIGRFDLTVDCDNKKIHSYEWEMIPIDEDHCPTDKMAMALTKVYTMAINDKYDTLVSTLARDLDNYGRGNPTECGQLFADAFCDSTNVDIFLLASSSLRCYSMNSIITLRTLRECYPYEGRLYKLNLKGSVLKKGLKHALRDEVIDDYADVFFQASKDLRIDYNRTNGQIQMWFKGEPLEDDRIYSVGMQEYYFMTSEIGLNMTNEELQTDGKVITLAESAFDTIFDYFSANSGLGGPVDDRIVIHY